jgi:MFS transporter, SP family, solute carrier family 2 (myo-inositol transporter), member 13
MISSAATSSPNDSHKTWSIRFLLFIAGLGGLLYGIDVGIIAGALPYLQETSRLNASQISVIVAAVWLGTLISTVFAGMLADWMGRRKLMAIGGLLFVVSIPMIALAHGYRPLVLGRLLQGISAGLIGIAAPLYLVECLPAKSRGKGTAVFQWLLTLGIVVAAVIGLYFSFRVEEVEKHHDASELFAFKDTAWRSIFWVSLPPGALFVIGSLLMAESPRWLFRRGRKAAALAALLRTRSEEQAALELREMEEVETAENTNLSTIGPQVKDSLLQRKYVIPFLLACIIPACNQASGVNSIIGYNATMLIEAGLSDKQAHLGYVLLTAVNFLVTIGGVMLVDRKGRRFLLSLGSAGIIVSLACTALVFRTSEKRRIDCADALQAMIGDSEQSAKVVFSEELAGKLLAARGVAGQAIRGKPVTLNIIYAYGDFRAATKVVRSDDALAKPIEINRDDCVPANALTAFITKPLADLREARTAPLRIENALITPVPSPASGWLTALCIYCYMASFAVGPGVCVWLAMSELIPTRIRSNGMCIAMLIAQAVCAIITAIFLPTVGKYGYSTMFFAFAGFTVIYFVTAFFFLPETKGKTLEEIEEHFSSHKRL